VTRVVIVADSGPVLAKLTTGTSTVPGAYVARHLSSAAKLERLVARLEPDLILIGDLVAADRALTLLAEVRSAAPSAKVVLLSSTPEATWLADALRAHADAVLPGTLHPHTLGVVLREVLADRSGATAAPSVPPLDRVVAIAREEHRYIEVRPSQTELA
jgi:DNA-binding NarL/FixJ family response regulator